MQDKRGARRGISVGAAGLLCEKRTRRVIPVRPAFLLCKSIAKNRMCHSPALSGQPGMMHKTSCTEEFACFRGAPHSA